MKMDSCFTEVLVWVDARVQFTDAEKQVLKVHGVVDQRNLEIPLESELEIQIIPEDHKGLAVRERINERIQAEVMAEEMLKVSPEWNEVPDLMMEDEDIVLEAEGYAKQ